MFFYSSLKSFKNKFAVAQLGIMDTFMRTKLLEVEFQVEKFLITNHQGETLINFTFNNSNFIYNNDAYTNQLARISTAKFWGDGKYFEIYTKKNSITLYKNVYNFVCVSSGNCSQSLIRFYMLFIANSLFNFIGENTIGEEIQCSFIFKLFELYFIEHLTRKFFSIIKAFLNHKEQPDKSIEKTYKIKNIIVIEFNKDKKDKVIFNIRSVRRKRNKMKFYNFQDHHIWEIIIQNFRRFKEDLSFKVELFPTYPRICFNGRFFQILNGIGLLEVYYCQKLSKGKEKYRELHISSVKKTLNLNTSVASEKNCNPNINEPTDRVYDVFLTEYFSCINSKPFFYYVTSSKLFYFNRDLLLLIDDSLFMKMSAENFISFLNKKLSTMLSSAKPNESSNENFLAIDKEFLVSVFFQKRTLDFSLGGSSINKTLHDETLSRLVSDITKVNQDNTQFMQLDELDFSNKIDDSVNQELIERRESDFRGSLKSKIQLPLPSKPEKFKQLSTIEEPKTLLYRLGTAANANKKDKTTILLSIQNKIRNYQQVNDLISYSSLKMNRYSSSVKESSKKEKKAVKESKFEKKRSTNMFLINIEKFYGDSSLLKEGKNNGSCISSPKFC